MRVQFGGRYARDLRKYFKWLLVVSEQATTQVDLEEYIERAIADRDVQRFNDLAQRRRQESALWTGSGAGTGTQAYPATAEGHLHNLRRENLVWLAGRSDDCDRALQNKVRVRYAIEVEIDARGGGGWECVAAGRTSIDPVFTRSAMFTYVGLADVIYAVAVEIARTG